MEKKLAHNDMHWEKVFQGRRNLPTIRRAALGWEEVFQIPMEKKLAHNDMHRDKVFQERRNLPTIRSAALGWEEVFQWRRNLPTMTCRKRRNRTSWVDRNQKQLGC